MSSTDTLADALAAIVRAASTASSPTPVPNRMYRVEEAAEVLRISRAHLYALIRSGEVRSVKLGRSRRITQAEIDRLMANESAA